MSKLQSDTCSMMTLLQVKNILAEEADPRPATPLRGNSPDPDPILKNTPDPTSKIDTDPVPNPTHKKWGSR